MPSDIRHGNIKYFKGIGQTDSLKSNSETAVAGGTVKNVVFLQSRLFYAAKSYRKKVRLTNKAYKINVFYCAQDPFNV